MYYLYVSNVIKPIHKYINIWEFMCFWIFFSGQSFSVYPCLPLNLLCRPGWHWTQRSVFLYLPGAGIKGMCHYTQPHMKNSIEINDNDSATQHRRLRIFYIKINLTLTPFKTKLCVDIFTLLSWDVFLCTVNTIG